MCLNWKCWPKELATKQAKQLIKERSPAKGEDRSYTHKAGRKLHGIVQEQKQRLMGLRLLPQYPLDLNRHLHSSVKQLTLSPPSNWELPLRSTGMNSSSIYGAFAFQSVIFSQYSSLLHGHTSWFRSNTGISSTNTVVLWGYTQVYLLSWVEHI